MDLDTAQLVVPIMDFVARWTMFRDENKHEAVMHFNKAGFSPEELVAVKAFIRALNASMEG